MVIAKMHLTNSLLPTLKNSQKIKNKKTSSIWKRATMKTYMERHAYVTLNGEILNTIYL
jgi:hypothetical protein